MNKALSLIHAVLLLVVAVPAQALETPQLRVLFLGDNDIHKPIERFNIVKPVLAKQGIEVVYTDDMRDISAAKLAGFDALAIYANITEIAPAQETALLEFVEGGGGLVAIHCASFLNSPKYVRLVGAKFESHGQGVFREVIVEADHPVMRGLTPIESWNETYIHAKFSEDRTVLAERRDDKGNEPWML